MDLSEPISAILSERLPALLRPPPLPDLLKPVWYSTRRRDPETLDLFTGEPKP